MDELPHSGNTISFKTKFEDEPTEEERRSERRRERRRRRKLTDEEDGPSEGTAKLTANKFEKGEIDDVHFHKTDISHDSMAESGTVMSTKEKFRSGKFHCSFVRTIAIRNGAGCSVFSCYFLTPGCDFPSINEIVWR